MLKDVMFLITISTWGDCIMLKMLIISHSNFVECHSLKDSGIITITFGSTACTVTTTHITTDAANTLVVFLNGGQCVDLSEYIGLYAL